VDKFLSLDTNKGVFCLKVFVHHAIVVSLVCIFQTVEHVFLEPGVTVGVQDCDSVVGFVSSMCTQNCRSLFKEKLFVDLVNECDVGFKWDIWAMPSHFTLSALRCP